MYVLSKHFILLYPKINRPNLQTGVFRVIHSHPHARNVCFLLSALFLLLVILSYLGDVRQQFRRILLHKAFA